METASPYDRLGKGTLIAVTYHGPADLRVERVADPQLVEPGDVIVRVELAAICGSDLHVWHGREVGLDPGTAMGHEFLGEIVAVGSEVTRFSRGDRVVSPFSTSCGACFYCEIGLTARCVQGQLFGWVEGGLGLHGGQAELVRVPLADSSLFPLPRELSAEAAILLGDVLATGYHGALLAGVIPGATCAVIGCGPVGLMGIVAARELGADRIFALDAVPARLAWAERLGAIPVAIDRANPLETVRAATQGRGADAVVEAVGSPAASLLAFELARAGGAIAAVGVHHEAGFPFSPGQAYDKNLTYRIGRCPVRHYMERLLPIARKRPTELAALFTHRLPLAQAQEGYRIFADKLDGCIKVALVP